MKTSSFILAALLATLPVIGQDHKNQWQGREEFNLFDSANKEQNPTTKLRILNHWKLDYPNSDFKVDRQETIMDTYKALDNADKMLNAAIELIGLDKRNVKGLYWVCLLTVSTQDKSSEALDIADYAANGLFAAIPGFFAANKPSTTSDDDWKKTRTNMEIIGHRTLGWTAMQRGKIEIAEKEFSTVLQNNLNDTDVSLWEHKIQATIAECHDVYKKTIDKKTSDLTVREEELIHSCKALEVYN